MMQSHHPTADRLEAFVEGTLDGSDRALVRSHLTGCPRCQTAVEEWQALFAALAGLPQLEPSVRFGDAVMARVRIRSAPGWQLAWQAAWHEQAERAGALVERVAPKSRFGWGIAMALLALPLVLGGGLATWLMTRSYLTPEMVWAWAGTTAVEGLQGVGATALQALLQTELAAWAVGLGSQFLATAGMTGLGAIIATAGAATLSSIWVLYRNLVRTPTRDSHYVTYSF